MFHYLFANILYHFFVSPCVWPHSLVHQSMEEKPVVSLTHLILNGNHNAAENVVFGLGIHLRQRPYSVRQRQQRTIAHQNMHKSL